MIVIAPVHNFFFFILYDSLSHSLAPRPYMTFYLAPRPSYLFMVLEGLVPDVSATRITIELGYWARVVGVVPPTLILARSATASKLAICIC